MNKRRKVYCTDSTGYDVVMPFRTVPDKSSFDRIVSNEVVAKGGNPGVNTTGHVTVIDAVLQKERVDGGVLTTGYGKSYFGYKHKVMLHGGDFVRHAPYSEIAKIVQKGIGVDWGIFILPSAISKSQRKRNFQRFNTHLSVDIQQRDDEPDYSYSIRSAYLGAYRDLVELFWRDVDEFRWTVAEANGESPFKSRIVIAARPGSELESMFGDLQAGAPPLIRSANPLTRLSLSLSIPTSLRPYMRLLVDDRAFYSTSTGRMTKDLVEAGVLRGAMELSIGEGNVPVVNGAISTSVESLSESAFASAFGYNKHVSCDFSLGDWAQEAFLRGRVSDRQFLFQLAEKPLNTDFPVVETGRASRTSLVTLDVDFAQLQGIESDHPLVQLLLNFEKFLSNHLSGTVSTADSKRLFEGVARHLTEDGEWNLTCSVRLIGNNKIVLDLSAGADLVALWRCRQYLDGRFR